MRLLTSDSVSVGPLNLDPDSAGLSRNFTQCAVRRYTEESLLANIPRWKANRTIDGCTPSETLNVLG